MKQPISLLRMSILNPLKSWLFASQSVISGDRSKIVSAFRYQNLILSLSIGIASGILRTWLASQHYIGNGLRDFN